MLPNYDIFGCNPLNTTKQVSAQLFFLDANVTLFFIAAYQDQLRGIVPVSRVSG